MLKNDRIKPGKVMQKATATSDQCVRIWPGAAAVLGKSLGWCIRSQHFFSLAIHNTIESTRSLRRITYDYVASARNTPNTDLGDPTDRPIDKTHENKDIRACASWSRISQRSTHPSRTRHHTIKNERLPSSTPRLIGGSGTTMTMI